jgi:DNA-binding CsgD family transcriptional regulator
VTDDLRRDADYPARVLDAILRIHLASSGAELLDAFVVVTAAIGASAGLYTVAIPEIGTLATSFSLFACHPGFALRQQRLGPLQDHPWFRFARSRTTPATWRRGDTGHPKDAAAIELARQYGFASCFIVPTPAGAGLSRSGMLCLGSPHEDEFDGDDGRIFRALARSLAAELHDRVTDQLAHGLQRDAQLHPIDIELLGLERRGLSTKAISLRTGMSPASIDSRFYRMNLRLDCASRGASAQRAAEYGLLEQKETDPSEQLHSLRRT